MSSNATNTYAMLCAKCGHSAYRYGSPTKPPCPYNGSLNAAIEVMLCELCHWLMVEHIWKFFNLHLPLPDWWGPEMRARFEDAKRVSIDASK